MRSSLSVYNSNPLLTWMSGDMDEWFNKALNHEQPRASHQITPYNVQESESGYSISIDLPGIRQEDLKIEILEGTLSIAGERKAGGAIEGQKVLCRFKVPVNADSNLVTASLEHGVLQIGLPKVAPPQPRKVEVQNGHGVKTQAS